MRVSVVIPAYNQGRYLAEAIESALNQHLKPAQIIVVDDGSTDETPEVCARYKDQIIGIRQPNGGVSAARNRGLAEVDADAVIFLDSDDILLPHWIAEAVGALEAAARRGQARADVVYCDYLLFDDGGSYERRIGVRKVSLGQLLRDSLLLPSGTLVTRRCIDEVGQFNGDLNTCEDWDFWLRAALRGYSFVRVPEVGFRHREHAQSASKRQSNALRARVRFLEHWSTNGSLDERQRAVVTKELTRTRLRQRRAAFFAGEETSPFVQKAVDALPSDGLDPWYATYASVYMAPFFRTQHPAEKQQRSIDEFARELKRALQEAGRLDARAERRVEASCLLAKAIDAGLRGKLLRAGTKLLSAARRDPSLVVDGARRSGEYVSEVLRIIYNT